MSKKTETRDKTSKSISCSTEFIKDLEAVAELELRTVSDTIEYHLKPIVEKILQEHKE